VEFGPAPELSATSPKTCRHTVANAAVRVTSSAGECVAGRAAMAWLRAILHYVPTGPARGSR